MISVALVQVALSATFSPPLLFVGETFSIGTTESAIVQDAVGVTVRDGRGVVRSQNASFWLVLSGANGLVDAAHIEVPVAHSRRWGSWPESSRVQDGTTFVVGPAGAVAIVPTRSGHGLCRLTGMTEVRFGELARLDVAVRSGPRHARIVKAETIYSGSDFAALYARPGDVARFVARVSVDQVDFILVAEYSMRGEFVLLGKSFALDLKKGERFQGTYSFLN